MRILTLNKENIKNVLDELIKRSPNHYGEYEKTVDDIVNDVKENGDKALFTYTQKFDKFALTKETIRVTPEEIEEAYASVSDEFIAVMQEAFINIRDYHRMQVRNSWFSTKPDGSLLGQRITPIETVGVYVPGGKAAYPSSTLMNIVPALVAGCERIVMVTPPNAEGKVNPGTLVAADIAGVNKIFKVGGAQAIAALAYGTQQS